MAGTPLFSKELRLLRSSISVSKMARLCGVSRETIRRIEAGQLLPSNSVLRAWLGVAGTSVVDRPDIARSVIAERGARNSYVRETEELRSELLSTNNTHAERVAAQVTELLASRGLISDESRDWMQACVRRAIEESLEP